MKKVIVIILLLGITVLAAIFLGAKPLELLSAFIGMLIYMIFTVALIRFLNL
jgi:hypothetical protein